MLNLVNSCRHGRDTWLILIDLAFLIFTEQNPQFFSLNANIIGETSKPPTSSSSSWPSSYSLLWWDDVLQREDKHCIHQRNWKTNSYTTGSERRKVNRLDFTYKAENLLSSQSLHSKIILEKIREYKFKPLLRIYIHTHSLCKKTCIQSHNLAYYTPNEKSQATHSIKRDIFVLNETPLPWPIYNLSTKYGLPNKQTT